MGVVNLAGKPVLIGGGGGRSKPIAYTVVAVCPKCGIGYDEPSKQM